MGLPNGMAENPGESYSLQSRLVCCKCWCEPTIKNPGSIKAGDSILNVTVMCHGKEETKAIQRSQLVFTQRFFEDEIDDSEV